ncbi:TPA: RHS repeat protein, partial [Escherichia coli]|nr:RHS repeat protein [Escherichia coli]
RQTREYGYSATGRLESVRTLAPDLDIRIPYASDPAGNRLPDPELHPDSTLTAWPDNRITEDAHYLYRYDRYGRLTEKTDRIPTGVIRTDDERTHHYHYDSQHRLVFYTRIQHEEPLVESRYLYDPLGRRTGKRVWRRERDLTGWMSLSRKPEVTWYGWDGDRLTTVQTDTTRIQTVYQPGSFAPLIRIETENGELDKAQRRSLVEKLQQEGSEDGHGVVFPVELVRMLDRLEGEIRADRVSSESRAWLAQCGLTVERLAAQIEPVYLPERKVHLYHCDHRGLPLALISEDGNTMWSAEYDEWGNLLNEENPHHLYQPYRLPGQQYDDESGLCYNRNRYYDPLQGRYITQDPIGLSGGWNLYQYPLNPVHKVDPLGLSAWDDAKSGACHEGICRLFSVFIGPDKFDSTDDAAFEALKKTNGHSICQGVEHAGLVCKDKNNKYFYTPPKQRNVNTSYPFESPCPNGTETVAMYHTHGSDSNGVYGDEVFSPADKELSKNKAISSYLGTPKGSFQKVEPNGDQPMNKSGLPSQCRVHANGEIY